MPDLLTETRQFRLPIGANPIDEGRCQFRVWAPHHERVTISISDDSRSAALERFDDGYHEATIDDSPPGTQYCFVLGNDKLRRPDPASRFQPNGVHGPSEVINPDFDWTDDQWHNPPIRDHVFYELHIGAFTPAGTFDAVIDRIDALQQLGITALQIMPIAQFPGGRNWGYDGVGLFAVQNSYGGIDGLRRLVNACHSRGLAVYLDVVYNHLGPEGNYLHDFGPYLTDRYHTPWGAALNFDGEHCDHVRRFFIANALHWVVNCHIDGLRLDAVHAIVDNSPLPFVEELTNAVHNAAAQLDRRIHVIAESASNDPRLLRPAGDGGYAMDAQWNDDFHHALHVSLTGERFGYYADYNGTDSLAKSMRDGFVYTGQYSPFHKRRHGRSTAGIPPERFIVFAQNHDQVGNRMNGDRLAALLNFEKQKLAASATLLSPFVPMLFMGEEYGETAPFLYFVSHSDPDLVKAVRRGRKNEFEAFEWSGEPPDPQAESTFTRSKLNWSLRESGRHQQLRDFYAALLTLRREVAALATAERFDATVDTPHPGVLVLQRPHPSGDAVIILNMSDSPAAIVLGAPPAQWTRLLDSSAKCWGGPGDQSESHCAGGQMVHIGPAAAAVYRSV